MLPSQTIFCSNLNGKTKKNGVGNLRQLLPAR